MVAVGFCSYWRLAVAAAAGSTAAAVLHNAGIIISTLPWRCAGILQIGIVSLPGIQGRAGLRAKVHVCRCGAFSVPYFDLVLDLVFSLYQNPSCNIQTRKRPASRFCLWASTVPTKKGPLETGVPMGFD